VPEPYALVKALHVGAVALSGFLFLGRALLVQTGANPLAFAAPVRYASYAVDTVLLGAGVALAIMLPAALFANHWLAVKLVLVVAYILLGSLALKRAPTARSRVLCLAAAIATYLFVVGIAVAHRPLGWLA
jgi:uncharacterized membrane protein SirB2